LLSIYDSGTLLGCGTEIAVAAIAEATVVFTIILGGQTFLLVQHFAIPNAQASQGTSNHPVNTDAQTLANFSTRITSIAVCQVKQLSCAIVTQWTGHSTVLTFQPIDGSMPHSVNIPETLGDGNHAIEEIVSIVTSTQSPGGLLVLCGTRNGVVVMLQLNEDSFEVAHCQYDHIGATPAILRKDNHIGKELFFVNTDSKVFAFAPAITSRYGFEPGILTGRTINQIWLTDVMNPGRQQPNINSLARLPINTSTGAANAIILVDGSQLFIAGLSTLPKAVPRQIPIGGTPSRLLYSHGLEVIIVGAVVNGKSTLMFVDPESGSDLSKCWDKQNNIETDSVGGLGYHNERIFRLFEWPFVKDGKTWNFIIVCTSAGRLLMISTEKEKDNHTPGHRETRTRPSIRYWTRYKWKCESPIYSAVGSDDGIFYCCGKTLNYETLDLTEKKFKKVAQYELPSAALNLIYENGKIYALTSVHSLEILELTGPTRSNFVRTHGDQITRNSLHNRVIGPSSDHPLHLISDKECSVVGLLATPNTRADTLEPVFEAELPHSILRFRYGSCRPVWDPTWWSSDKAQNGTSDVMDARSAIDYPEILGLSIDGSLCHFTVLNFTTWNFLRFLVNLALQSPRVCEFTYEGSDALKMQLQPATEPKLMMHVNGDILRRCLEERRLEELLGLQNAEVGGKIQTKFRELIEALHRGRLGKNSAMSTLVERAYEDLEFFLRPVL
jgi:hypothetical protein